MAICPHMQVISVAPGRELRGSNQPSVLSLPSSKLGPSGAQGSNLRYSTPTFNPSSITQINGHNPNPRIQNPRCRPLPQPTDRIPKRNCLLPSTAHKHSEIFSLDPTVELGLTGSIVQRPAIRSRCRFEPFAIAQSGNWNICSSPMSREKTSADRLRKY